MVVGGALLPRPPSSLRCCIESHEGVASAGWTFRCHERNSRCTQPHGAIFATCLDAPSAGDEVFESEQEIGKTDELDMGFAALCGTCHGHPGRTCQGRNVGHWREAEAEVVAHEKRGGHVQPSGTDTARQGDFCSGQLRWIANGSWPGYEKSV